jgi:hypothetical protein
MIHSPLVKALFYKQLQQSSISKISKSPNFGTPLKENPHYNPPTACPSSPKPTTFSKWDFVLKTPF